MYKKLETIKLFSAEWNLMQIVWENAPVTASKVAAIAGQRFGWAKNTTYTVLKRLIAKRVIERGETDFTVEPLISRQQVQQNEANALLEKLFAGSVSELLSTLIAEGRVNEEELEQARRQLEEVKTKHN